MRLLAVNVCKQLRYRLGNEINRTIIRRYNGAMFEEQPDQMIKSKLFPDYNVVYVYPMVHVACLCNRIKRNYTVFSIACVPITVTLQMLGAITLSTCIGFTTFAGALALPLHTLCYYWNNTVGSIYSKDGDSKVIISYVNYWGKRLDLTIEKDKILPFMEVPYNTPKSKFMRVKIDTVKPTLKLILKNKYIYRPPVFHNIFGDVK